MVVLSPVIKKALLVNVFSDLNLEELGLLFEGILMYDVIYFLSDFFGCVFRMTANNCFITFIQFIGLNNSIIKFGYTARQFNSSFRKFHLRNWNVLNQIGVACGIVACEKGIRSVGLFVIETFWLRNSGLLKMFIKGLKKSGINISSLNFFAVEAHNGCRIGNLKRKARKKRKRRK